MYNAYTWDPTHHLNSNDPNMRQIVCMLGLACAVKEDLQFRLEWAWKCRIGFDLPPPYARCEPSEHESLTGSSGWKASILLNLKIQGHGIPGFH
jgi:hypothetical protein